MEHPRRARRHRLHGSYGNHGTYETYGSYRSHNRHFPPPVPVFASPLFVDALEILVYYPV